MNPKIMQVASSKTFQERQVIIQGKDPWAEPVIVPTALWQQGWSDGKILNILLIPPSIWNSLTPYQNF